MDRIMKERVLRAANSKPVKEDVWLWVKITSAICLGFILLLTLSPWIADYIDSWHPYTQCAVTITTCLILYFYIRTKTK